MSRESIERDVAGVLRDHVLLDSDREIAFDAPLGPGAGLDSLGLMEFLAALEERFDVDFPDSLVDYLDAMGADVSPSEP